MSKSMQKRNAFNTSVINRLVEKHAVSQRFVRMSLDGDRTSARALKIKDDYRVMLRELKRLLNKL